MPAKLTPAQLSVLSRADWQAGLYRDELYGPDRRRFDGLAHRGLLKIVPVRGSERVAAHVTSAGRAALDNARGEA